MKSLLSLLPECRSTDRFRLRRQILNLKQNASSEQLQALQAEIEKSRAAVSEKRASFPKIQFPEALPVVQERTKIMETIAQHQVVVVAGETGSGKTTQLPKILLEMGYGAAGLIGHTQPRRLAARSVAQRIADELGERGQSLVGHKIRFQDETSDSTSVKLMTDGILLAELQNDRFLNAYDVIIIDEAHERSLNIDFLLGVLHQLLEKRPDLKLIITSATIETDKFSKHFNHAPVLEVSGRTYPVEMRYRPLERVIEQEGEQRTIVTDFDEAVIDAIDELWRDALGDILIFLSGEREIRDLAEVLSKHYAQNCVQPEIIPLFARLSAQEQNRVFQSHQQVRIVLATNVAETSLTVPGIRYVIDSGLARISRYSYRSKVQRLPVEPISQASANQRAGRCGRLGPGICIRLYSEADFQSRPEFTDPEILRTNLASVILQMASLKLGDIRSFPFLQKPDERFINDGLRLLEELQAIKPKRKGQRGNLQLTPVGRQLGRLPVDPKLAKMIIAATERNCLREVLVITAALSIQDPRERPLDAQQKSDQLHQRFQHESSDFLSFLKLWDYLQSVQKEVSKSQFRKRCKQEFIHYLRVREWQDLYAQLRFTARELGFRLGEEPANEDHIHQALLSGLLSQVGTRDEKFEYLGARQTKFYLFPGSVLFKSKPKWVMSAELVETSRLYARNNAQIHVDWLEPLAQHLVKRNYHEPFYAKKQGAVVANEQVTLFGLLIVPNRKIQFGRIDPVVAREIFIKEALVHGGIKSPPDFVRKNQEVIEEIHTLEAKSRRRDLLVDEFALFSAYERHIPEGIFDDRSLHAWWKGLNKDQQAVLFFTESDLLQQDTSHVQEAQYPDVWQQGAMRIPIEYVFEPSADNDGVNVDIPLAALTQIEDNGFDWQVPGLRAELVTSWIKSLPKKWRRNFVPAPEYAKAILASAEPCSGSLLDAMTKELKRMSGLEIPRSEWNIEAIPKHLRIHFRIRNEKNEVVTQGNDLSALKLQLAGEVKDKLSETAGKKVEQEGLVAWNFGALPAPVEKRQGAFTIKAFPALQDEGKSVAIRVFDSEEKARLAHRKGVLKLLYLQCASPVKYLQQSLPEKAKLAMYFNPWGKIEALIEDCIYAAIDSLVGVEDIVSEVQFNEALHGIKGELNEKTLGIAKDVQMCLWLGHEINKKTKGKIPLAQARSYADIKEHLETLIFPGFVSEFGVLRLADIQRYLRGLQSRIEKLEADPNRDRLRVLQVEKIESAWKEAMNSGENDVALAEFRWHIEEFRVSLFAQQLGTAFPVSEQRLSQTLKSLSARG
ncbi:ATP-dependent helicase HrpA [Idiomarinaceae bacterium HL-53]|nr:ATP-dependent helicase HrpA [Idiomarinaceae bacterium HL-53]